MLRAGSRASSARFDTVSIPVYAIIADGDREQELAPGRGDAPVRRSSTSVAGLKIEHEAEQDEQQLRREVDDGEQDVQRRGLLDADDVQRDEDEDHRRCRR